MVYFQKYEVCSKDWKKICKVYAHFKCCSVLVWTFRNIVSQEYRKHYPSLQLKGENGPKFYSRRWAELRGSSNAIN